MLVNREVGHATAILENLPTNTKRTDALEAAQVDGWWSGVEQLGNRRPRRPSRWTAGGLAWSSWATEARAPTRGPCCQVAPGVKWPR